MASCGTADTQKHSPCFTGWGRNDHFKQDNSRFYMLPLVSVSIVLTMTLTKWLSAHLLKRCHFGSMRSIRSLPQQCQSCRVICTVVVSGFGMLPNEYFLSKLRNINSRHSIVGRICDVLCWAGIVPLMYSNSSMFPFMVCDLGILLRKIPPQGHKNTLLDFLLLGL